MRKFLALFRSRRADQLLARMEGELRRMDPATREVFLLHRLDDLAYPVIAEKLGIGVGEVEQRMAEAILRLTRVSSTGAGED
ncbi:RNA polymerase sigma factor [Sphingomonas sp. Sphisp140]|uniref:RNA polymerase sigma factor n=1 Tax=unclassified Sphingomonas TaxID=196159 RepID=UPI0039AF07F1